MKHIVFVVGLLLIVLCTHTSANSSFNIDGTWSGVYDSKGKDGQPPKKFIFKFKSDSGSVTGTACDATINPDVWIELKNIKLEGKRIYFTSEPVQGMTIKYEGELGNDKIDLTFTFVSMSIITPDMQSTKEKVVTGSFILERENKA